MNTLREAASAREGPGQRGLITLDEFVFIAVLLFFIFLAFWVDRLFRLPESPEYPVNLFISIPLLSVGAGLLFWSAICFVRQTGKLLPVGATPKLIKGGPYELARNPMFTGIFFILFGIGFASQSISLVFIFTPLFILLSYLAIRLIEEPRLERRFGREYAEYKKNTPMFYPVKKRAGR